MESVLQAMASGSRPHTAAELGLETGKFALATIHRPEDTDNRAQLAAILSELAELPVPVALPLHPRTAARIEAHRLGSQLRRPHTLPPVDRATFLSLASDCALLISDSGGVQEECTVQNRPLIVVRNSTERPESIEAGFAHLARPGTALGPLARALLADPGLSRRLARTPGPYGDGTLRPDHFSDLRPRPPPAADPARRTSACARGPRRQGGTRTDHGRRWSPSLLKPPPGHAFAISPNDARAMASQVRAPGRCPAAGAALPPPASCPGRPPGGPRVAIPSLRITAAVKRTSVVNGALIVPSDVQQVGLDTGSASLRAARGTTIVAGHINNIDQGDGVFYRLDQVRPGADVTVYGPDGSLTRWRVYKVKTVSKAALPAGI